MRNYLLTGIILLTAVACATTPTPKREAPASLPPIDADIRELREAIASDLERTAPVIEPASSTFDPQAIASIEMPSHPTIDGAVRYFSTGLKPSIQRSLTRSAEYKSMIDRVLDEHRVPRAFAYLPVIESGYSASLTSSAGARGIWQFMPATAREYGLRVDWWVDDRIDPEKSTVAAATYLKDLYRMFSDWPLVLAAYNCGPGRVRRTLNEHSATTFWELLEKSVLPKETRGYVPTFFATVAIAGNPENFGFELRDPLAESEQRWTEIEVRGPLSLEFIAEVADADAGSIRTRNARFHRGLVPPGVHSVQVPRTAAQLIASRRETLREEDPIAEVASYTLKPGETLASLARITGAKLDDVLAMNGVRADEVRAGDSIYLPVRPTRLSTLLIDSRSPAPEMYIVDRGDTLYSIARRYELSVEEIRAMNELDSDAVIQPGQRLRVRTGAVTAGGM